MHRCGTSAVTRGLQALGVDLGSSLMPGVLGDNDKGYFEDMEINGFNIELLNALDNDWHTLPLIPAEAFKQKKIALFKSRAIMLIRAKMGDQPFGLKDPRITQLLPFWKTVFDYLGVTPSYVIAVRHPMSVARSLANGKRGTIEDEKSYYLWLKHVIPSILETTNANRVVVDFDLLISHPQAQLKRVA